MNPKPLKGKHFSIDDRFKREDIRSAVEWEREMKKLVYEAWECLNINIDERVALIQWIEAESFVDVMK